MLNKELFVNNINETNFKELFGSLDKPITGYSYYDMRLLQKINTFKKENIKYIFNTYINVRKPLIKYNDVDDLSYSKERAVKYDLLYIDFLKII